MKKIIALLLCVALCACMLCACKEKTDPKDLLPMHTVPETNENVEDNRPTINGRWEINEKLTCLEFTERIEIAYGWSFANDIVMRYVEDAKDPRYELVLNTYSSHEVLLCTVTKDGTQWKDGAPRLLDFHEINQEVSWEFYTWLQANAKPVTA